MKFWTSLPLSLLISFTSYADSISEGTNQDYLTKIFSPSTTEKVVVTDNKSVVENFFQAFQTNDVKTLNAVLSDGYGVTNMSDVQDSSYSKYSEMSKNMKVRASSMKKALPDFTIKIDELIAEGDKVVARISIHGIQKGDFFGVAPTNKPVSIKVFSIFTVKENKIAYIQEMWNEYSVMKQIGYFVL